MKYSRRHQAVCHRHFTSINSESKRKRIGLRDLNWARHVADLITVHLIQSRGP
jgi:hypothetical protein